MGKQPQNKRLTDAERDIIADKLNLIAKMANRNGFLHCGGDHFQNILLEVCKRLPNFDPTRSSLNTFIGNSAKFSSYSANQKHWAEKESELPSIPLDLTPKSMQFEPDLGSGLQSDERNKMIASVISSLSENGQKIIFLKFFIGIEDREIARKLKLSYWSYWGHKNSALNKLRARLRKYEL